MKECKNIPEIRFKGFENPWIQKEIKELFKITRGEVLAATETSQVKTGFMTYPVYSSQTKNNGLMGYYHDYLFENAITWTTDGANAGTVKYRKGKFYSTNVNGVLLSDDGYANQAIAESINIIAWKHVSYVGNPKLMNNVMSKIKIYISDSLEEQQLISDYFNTFDTFISLEQQKHDKLVTLKKAMLEKMFPKEGASVPEIRFEGFEGKWEERNIGQIAKVSTGYPFESNLFNDKGKLLVITNGNIQNNSAFVDKSVGNRIDINNDIILNEYILKKNDILVTMDGTVGRTAKVKEQNQILAQRVGRLTSNTEAEFLYQFLNTGKFFQKMMSISHGGTIKHISLLEISNYKDLVPTNKKEQSQIGSYFQNLDNLISLQQQKIDKLKNIKKACLDKMFV